MKNSTKAGGIPTLLSMLIQLLEAHRPSFKRAVELVLAELFSFGQHMVAQDLPL